jgi:hypothetical protein
MALVHENHGNIRLANILGVYHIWECFNQMYRCHGPCPVTCISGW